MKHFNYSNSFNNYASEHYKLFGRPVRSEVKKQLKKIKPILVQEDEHYLFELLVKLMFDADGVECPKCSEKSEYYSDRWKRINKVIKKQKFVRVEKDRTFTCHHCSFVFSPLANTPYRNTNIDLRCYLFYDSITLTNKIDIPITSISRIFNIKP